jgi:hypothetical protein
VDVTLLNAALNGAYTLPGLSIAIVRFQSVPEPASGSAHRVALLGLAVTRVRNRSRKPRTHQVDGRV